MVPERQWIAAVRRAALRLPGSAAVPLGIGDDAALLRPRPGHDLALTTDLMVEGVHFLRPADDPASCGWRLAARGFSDLAAMGARPFALFASTAFPASLPSAWPRAFLRGLLAACRDAGAILAGGDTAAAPLIVLDAVAVGEVRRGRARLRSGARPGDWIFVSGPLGLAARGRRLVHAGSRPSSPMDRAAIRRHRRPLPRWREALDATGLSASIDISDGLSTDLHHLCRASGVGAALTSAAIPAPCGLGLALHGGEDYELLVTAPPGRRLPGLWTPVGEITRRAAVTLDGKPLPDRGWQHFSL